MKGRAVLFGGLMLVATSASAQGVFSFEGIPLKAEPSVEVNLDSEMIKLLAGAAQDAPGAPSGLEGFTNVRVLVYENIAEDMQAVLRYVESTGTKLEGDGWRAVVRVREEGEQVRVYMKPGADGTLSGVTVMVTETGDGDDDDDDGGGGEAVFLNVAGTIRPEQLGQIASMHGVLNGVPGFSAAPERAPD